VGLAEAAGDGEGALGLGLGLAVLLPSPPQPPIEKASSPIVAKYKSLCIADRPQMLNFKISNKALQLQPVVVLSLSVFDVMRSLLNCQVFLIDSDRALRAIGFREQVRISMAVVVRHIELIKAFI
jgi:hypothetical protein